MLCHVCEAIFSKVPDLLELNSKYIEFDHHSSHASLHSSATNGCYICSKIVEFIAAKDFRTDLHSVPPVTIWHVDRSHRKAWPTAINVWLSNHYILDRPQYGPDAGIYANEFCFRHVVPHDPSDGSEARLRPTAFWDSTGSAETISQIVGWLERCTVHHDLCNLRPETAWMPSRLLEVTEESGILSVHLRDRSQLQFGPYITLSHCWGTTGTQNLQLTTKSLKSFQDGVAVSTLRPTFRDLANMAWRLGLRLMWVDCMCIVQDDDQDWKRESALMGKVYANSWLNVSATAAGIDCSGLFASRNGSRPMDYFHTQYDKYGETATWEVTTSEIWFDEVEDAAVNQRAWVLQERILSPRIVHMSKSMAFWECRTLQASEVFPYGDLPDEESLNNYGQLKRLYCQSRSADVYDVRDNWGLLLFRYTMCGLTFETDRLIALSGIASEIYNRTRCDYVAGLWSSQLPVDLLWRVDNPGPTRLEFYIAPSWSWASVKGLIWFSRQVNVCGLYTQILRCETSLANAADKYGQVTGGEIELRASIGSLDWSGVQDKIMYKVENLTISVPDESGGTYRIREISSFPVMTDTLTFDGTEYAELHTAYVALVLHKPEDHRFYRDVETYGYSLKGLILNRLPCKRYMRIGVAGLHYDTEQELEDVVSKMPKQDITII